TVPETVPFVGPKVHAPDTEPPAWVSVKVTPIGYLSPLQPVSSSGWQATARLYSNAPDQSPATLAGGAGVGAVVVLLPPLHAIAASRNIDRHTCFGDGTI